MNENIEKYSLYDPTTASLIVEAEDPDYQFCYTHRGEINLRHKDSVYHEMDGALEEARDSLKNSFLVFHNTLILYGIGLGYQYLALKKWLQENPQRVLLVLEDDLMVLKHFMETENAKKILSDPQVVIHYIPSIKDEELPQSLKYLLRGFVHGETLMIASPFYSRTRASKCELLRNSIYNFSMEIVRQLRHLSSDEIRIFTNFYANILRLPGTYQGANLKGSFEKIPAIICGAGPSIVEHIEQIRQLDDRALIIGSGTGMNVLNNHNIFAHLGIGLDPTNSQGTRIRTNQAYECPYAYQFGFHTESFDLLHGPKILFHGMTNYPIRRWFLEKLKIDPFEDLYDGVSSTNLAMGVAHFMGCSPIILLGCDLAYRNDLRYPKGVHAHAADPMLQREKIEYKSEALCMGQDSMGNPLITKPEWLVEGDIITEFCNRYPEQKVINSTSGGLHIEGVLNLEFGEVMEEHLTQMHDIGERLHTEIQGQSIPVKKGACVETLKCWQDSLKRCEAIYDGLLVELTNVKNTLGDSEALPEKPYSDVMAKLEEDLEKEDAYQYLLTSYEDLFEAIATKEKIYQRCHAKNPSNKQLEIDLNRLLFFRSETKRHLHLIDRVFSLYDTPMRLDGLCTEYFLEEPPDISDIEPNEVECRWDGTVLCKQSTKNGMLDGAVNYYGRDGELSSQSNYSDGKKEGSVWRFYSDGSVYYSGNYRDGFQDGKQLFFYRGGCLKSELPYSSGKLHGDMRLYYPNGTMKRLVQFDQGLLHGIEKYWRSDGMLLWECTYKKGQPYGKARSWHLNGVQATECDYDLESKTFLLKEWNEKGQLVYEKRCSLETEKSEEKKLSQSIEEFEKEMHVLEHAKGFYQNKLRF